jgi:hypothetical protein
VTALGPDALETFLSPTRRDLIKMALAASALATPFGKAAAGFAATTQVSVTRRRRSVTFQIDGSDVFTIDAARFAGSPRVSLTAASDGTQRVALTGARWPGTHLRADMTLTLDGGRLEIALAFGGFRARVSAREWLLGEKVASSRVSLPGLVCDLDSRGSVALSGSALAEFTPDWRVSIFGVQCATVSAHGATVRSSEVEISLPAADEPSAFSRAIARRASVRIERGSESWRIAPALLAEKAGALNWAPAAVETLTLDLAESGSGRVYRALIADAAASSAAGPAASFTPSPNNAFSGQIPLVGVRAIAAFDAAGDGVAVLADIPNGSRVATGGLALELGDSDTATFEATGRREATSVSAAPRVKAIAVGVQGALASPIDFPEGSHVVANLGTSAVTSETLLNAPGDVNLPQGSHIEIIRPDDMLNLSLGFYGVKIVDNGTGRKLLPQIVSSQTYLAYGFPPQAFNEQTLWDTTDPNDQNVALPSIDTPVIAQISGRSQLAFRFTQAMASTGIPYTLDSLLDWSALSPVIGWWGLAEIPSTSISGWRPTDPRVDGGSGPFTMPNTYLEMPFHLYLSPNEYGYWQHRIAPSTDSSGAWTGLWHTRLRQSLVKINPASLGPTASAGGTPRAESQLPASIVSPHVPPVVIPPLHELAEPMPQVRPIWAPEFEAFYPYAPATYIPPTNYSLSAKDRADLVRLTELRKAAVDAPTLMLTSLGGWMDLSGTWDEVSPDLKEWKHKATLGRDHYVRIARGGYLFPFGHKAVEIKITERRFANAPIMPGVATSGRKHAYLYTSTFIVLLEPTRVYENTDHLRDRAFPFRQVTIVTKQTPKLDKPVAMVDGLDAAEAFFPVVSGKRFLFETKALDYDGNEISFLAPLAFFGQDPDSDATSVVHMSDAYLGANPAPVADMRGQSIALADSGGTLDSTTLATTKMQFDSIPMTSPSEWASADPRKPHFFPMMAWADVKSDALSQVTSTDAGARVHYYDAFLGGGFRAGQVFLEIEGSIPIDYSAASAGGLASPRMIVKGLSRSRGPVCGDLATFDAGTFDPAQYFVSSSSSSSTMALATREPANTPPVPDAKLLGFIPLGDVLSAAGVDSSPIVSVGTDAGDLVTAFDWSYEWSGGTSLALSIFETNGMGSHTTLHLRNEFRTPVTSGNATKNVTTGELKNFALSFEPGGVKILRVAFDAMGFRSATGEGTTLSPAIDAVEFGDALKFLDTLRQYIPSGSGPSGSPMRRGLVHGPDDGDPGGSGVSVSSEGIVVSESVLIPTIGLGVCALTNVNIGAIVTIPFSDNPASVAFNVSTVENPFGVSVCLIAGFGSFEMELSAAGIQKLDASIQAGAMLSLNLGVASGTVSVAFGFHFRRDGDTFAFDAFYRISGEVSVLGLISVGITLMLSLGFQGKPAPQDGGTLVGTATLAVKIKIAFFHKTVHISVRRELAGSDPLFTNMMSESEWTDQYCAAFAPVPAGV